MKRFTETTKWNDPWYRRLSPLAKHLLSYLRDVCDCAGVVEIDLDAASFVIGDTITQSHVAEIQSRLEWLPNGKVLMPKFIGFQYGDLSAACPAHKPIFKAVAAHGLVQTADEFHHPSDEQPDLLPTHPATHPNRVSNTLQEKEKDTDKDRKGDARGASDPEGPEWESAKSWLSDWKKNGADYTQFEARGAFLALQASGWMWGRNKVADPRAALERQIQTDRERKSNANHSRNGKHSATGLGQGTANEGMEAQYAGGVIQGGESRVPNVQQPGA